jgi:peroxiredoxin
MSFKIGTALPKFQNAEARVDGTFEMLRRTDAVGWLTRREGTGSNLAPKPVPYLVTSDGQVVSWIDHDKQTVYEKYTRSAKGQQVAAADQGWIRQFVDTQPFGKELAAPKATLEGTATADGTPCDIVLVNYGENKETRKWFFAAADHLPRRLEISIGAFQTIYEITDLKVNPELSAERFTLATPEGYKREAVVKPVARTNPESGDTPPVIPARARPLPGDEDAPPALRPAPAFELKSLDGKRVSLESLKGKVAVLGFWGAWHRGGRMAAPEFQGLADHFKGKAVEVYWLALKGKDPEDVAKFAKDTNLTIGVLPEADGVQKDFQVKSNPGFVVVGFGGEVLHQSGGFVAQETMGEIQKVIDTYLENGGKMPEPEAVPAAPGVGNTPGGPSRPLVPMPAPAPAPKKLPTPEPK